MAPSGRIKRWRTLREGALDDRGVFSFQEIERLSPRTDRVGNYKVLRIAPWVNVIALTPAREVVLVEQYRHGIDDITFEIPGGLVEPGEEHATGAARELEEETGYRGSEPILLGTVHPNPAIQDNICSTWLVNDALPSGEQCFDEGEDIAVTTVPLSDIPAWFADGRITHSLVVAAFHWLALYQGPSYDG